MKTCPDCLAAEARADTAEGKSEQLQIEVDGQRRMFADYADRIQELQIKAENAEWGHFKHNIMGMLNTIHASATRCAKGELGYIAIYNKLRKERDDLKAERDHAREERDKYERLVEGLQGHAREVGDALEKQFYDLHSAREELATLKAKSS